MPDIYIDVDTAVTVPVNVFPLIDDADFKSREVAIAYDESGMDLVWNFVTSAGVITQTAVTPTTAGDYDWTHSGDGMYKIEIPASGGASIDNDTEGYGWFSGICDGVLPWRGPVIQFRASGLNDLLCDSAFSVTRGLAGTALPAAVADAAGGLPISDAGGLDLDAMKVVLDGLGDKFAILKEIIESQRGHHTATGNVFHWAPINGSDGNDGLTKATARKTFASINTNLVVAWNHDVIILYADEAAAQTVITETIDMNKAYTFIRGPGRDVLFKPTTSTNDTVTISAIGCEFTGAIVETHTAGAKKAIKITADFAYVHTVWVDYSRGDGINLDGVSNSILEKFTIQTAAAGGSGHALVVEGTSVRNIIKRGTIIENAGDGVRVVGPNTEHNFFVDMLVHDNSGYGINETANSNETIVLGGHYEHNVSGDINLNVPPGGSSTSEKLGQWLLSSDYTVADNAGIADIQAVTDLLPDAGALSSLATAAALATVDTEVGNIQADLDNGADGLGAIKAAIAALNDPTVAAIADAIWDEAQAGHTGVGSFGKYLDTEVSGVGGASAGAVADAVWDEGRSGHVTQGSFGESFKGIVKGTVDTATFSPTTTAFEADDITEATADHYNGRSIVFLTGALAGQATPITDYVLANSKGKFTVTAMTEAPGNNAEFIII